MSRNLYSQYICRIENNLQRNSKVFWSYINSLKKYNELPNLRFLNDRSATNDKEITNLFSSHFSSVYLPAYADNQNDKGLPNPIENFDQRTLSNLSLNENEV